MNWVAISSVSEILSATGVIASLLYVGRQVWQNTRAMHAAAIDAHIASANFVRQQIVDNAEVAEIYRRGLENPDELTPSEKVRFRVLLQSILWTSWNAFAQTRLTGLDASTFEAQKPFIQRVVTSSGGRWFWSEYAHEFETEFRAEIEKIIS